MKEFLHNIVNIYILWQILLYLLLISGVILNCLIFIKISQVSTRGVWYNYLGDFRFFVISLFFLFSLINLYLLYEVHFNHIYNYNYLLNYMFNKYIYIFFMFNNMKFCLNEISLIFAVLVSFLYPLILILLQYDLSIDRYKYYSYMVWLYCIIYIFLFTKDILIFYITYELMIGLVFYIMYLSANNRGGIEAILFFLGWASIGSFLVGMAILYIIIVGNVREFEEIRQICFTANERYYLYIFLFFGFGTKLSIWPFWYWLPRAHVEVSTSLSIFLSCILVKICFYGLLRMHLIIGGEIIILPFIFFIGLSVFDVTIRLIIQVDLKAVTAYGSVLHVNLLVLLFLVDTSMINNGLIFYIWGHSYATAGMFFVIHLIERCCGTRLTFELSGIYQINPLVSIFVIMAFVAFLEFPLNLFFWGEFWMWVSVIEVIPLSATLILFISVVIYIIIFFWIWWSIMFGNMACCGLKPYYILTYEDIWIGIYLILFQYIIGIQPHLLSWCMVV